MPEMIGYPVCSMCWQKHLPGLLNCPPLAGAEAFNFGEWITANGSKLKTMSQQIEGLLGAQLLGAPPTPEMKALETLRAVRNQLQAMFLDWRRERSDTWDQLTDEVLDEDTSGTAHWLYHVLEDMDELILRHEKALVSMLEDE